MSNIQGETPSTEPKKVVKIRRDTEPNPILRRAIDEVLKDIYYIEREAAVSSLATLIKGISERFAVNRKELAIVLADKVTNQPSKLDPKLLAIWKRYNLETHDLIPGEDRTLEDLKLTPRNKTYLDHVSEEFGASVSNTVQNAVDQAVNRFQGKVATKYRVKEEDLAKFVRIRIQINKQEAAFQRSKGTII